MGIDISAGRLSRPLTEGREPCHQEKEELLPAGLAVSSYVGVGDTAARHRRQSGSCLCLGNDLFASFGSTDSKSRLNFLRVLRQPHTDDAANEVAVAYWRRQGLAAALTEALVGGSRRSPTRRPGMPHGRSRASRGRGPCASPPRGRCWAA